MTVGTGKAKVIRLKKNFKLNCKTDNNKNTSPIKIREKIWTDFSKEGILIANKHYWMLSIIDYQGSVKMMRYLWTPMRMIYLKGPGTSAGKDVERKEPYSLLVGL